MRYVVSNFKGRASQLQETPVKTSDAAYHLLKPWASSDREIFLAIHLDGKHRVRGIEQVSIGSATNALVHPREVFGAAVRLSSAAIIVAHCHPSGDPTPSSEDIETTKRLVSSGNLIGIPVLDHIVFSDSDYVSLRTSNKVKFSSSQ